MYIIIRVKIKKFEFVMFLFSREESVALQRATSCTVASKQLIQNFYTKATRRTATKSKK